MTQATRENAGPMTVHTSSTSTRRGGSHQLAQFQFPGEDAPDADKTLEIRPRKALSSAGATQEIDAADVLEVEPIDHHPSSVIPIAIDVSARRPRASELVGANTFGASVERPQRRVGWGLGAAIFGTGCLVLALVNAARASSPDPAAPQHAVTAAAAPAPVAAPGAVTSAGAAAPAGVTAASGVPTVSINNLPRVIPTTGTIRLIEAAAAHRLWVDGALQAGPSAVVSCGRHMIKVGSAGTAHAMIIGCGEETVIAR